MNFLPKIAKFGTHLLNELAIKIQERQSPEALRTTLDTIIAVMLAEIDERSESYRRASYVFARVSVEKIYQESGYAETARAINQWKEDADAVESYLEKCQNPARATAESILEIDYDHQFEEFWNHELSEGFTHWLKTPRVVPDFITEREKENGTT